MLSCSLSFSFQVFLGGFFLLFISSLPLIFSSLIFGAITCVTGLLGVVIGAATTRLFRKKTERADPLVCAVSMLGSAIFICLIFVVAKKSIVGAYVRASRRRPFWTHVDPHSRPPPEWKWSDGSAPGTFFFYRLESRSGSRQSGRRCSSVGLALKNEVQARGVGGWRVEGGGWGC